MVFYITSLLSGVHVCVSSFILDDHLEKRNCVPQSTKHEISAEYLFLEQITGHMGKKAWNGDFIIFTQKKHYFLK